MGFILLLEDIVSLPVWSHVPSREGVSGPKEGSNSRGGSGAREGGALPAPFGTTKVGSTHPTGMLSCFKCVNSALKSIVYSFNHRIFYYSF